MKRRLGKIFRAIEAFVLDRSEQRLFASAAILLTFLDLRREAAAVVAGRRMSRNGDLRGSLTALRRDVHRLEKGIIMRPRRIPFGKDYVPGAVASFAKLDATSSIPAEDREWAVDVLSQYFEITGAAGDPWLTEARRHFERLGVGNPLPAQVPYARSVSPEASVTIEQLEMLSRRRRSVRWFADVEVDPTAVDRALMVAGQAPSACNRQNVRFHLVYGTEDSAKVLGTVGGTRGFAHQVPAVAVVIGRLAGYRHAFDRHAIFIDGGLASMSLLYALETQGLSSCCINWPDVGAQYSKIRKLVPLESDEQVLMLVAIGTASADGMIPFSSKRGISTLRTGGTRV